IDVAHALRDQSKWRASGSQNTDLSTRETGNAHQRISRRDGVGPWQHCVFFSRGAGRAAGHDAPWRRDGRRQGPSPLVRIRHGVPEGGCLPVSAGAALEAFRVGAQSVDVQLNAGWKYRTIPKASNQAATWNRFPIEAMLALNTPVGLRFAGGGVVHLANKLEA